jgi:hypothetical protein
MFEVSLGQVFMLHFYATGLETKIEVSLSKPYLQNHKMVM